MPITSSWMTDQILHIVWKDPLHTSDLIACFNNIVAESQQHDGVFHVIFDVQEAEKIPMNAPYIALRSNFMNADNLSHVAVVGMGVRAQALADMVVKVTRKDIIFFETYDEALNYIQAQIDLSDAS